MFPFIKVTIRTFERGFLFREGELVRVLAPGKYRMWNALGKLRVDVSSLRQAWLQHPDLDLIVKSGLLGDEATVLELAQNERALVWIDDRFDAVVGPGRHVLWNGFRRVRVERIDARVLRFAHAELGTMLTTASAGALLERLLVPQGAVGLVYADGALYEALAAGEYAFWKGVASLRLYSIDAREAVLDVAGQEIMTADKVTLRMNAVVTFRVTDAARAVTAVEDFKQALYREAQLALRAVVGTRALDALLADKKRPSPTSSRPCARAPMRSVWRSWARHPRRHPAGRDEAAAQQGDRGQEGGRGRAHHAARGDGGHAQPGEHGASARSQPDAHAAA